MQFVLQVIQNFVDSASDQSPDQLLSIKRFSNSIAPRELYIPGKHGPKPKPGAAESVEHGTALHKEKLVFKYSNIYYISILFGHGL